MRKWLTRSMVPVALAATALVAGALPAAPSGQITTLVTSLEGRNEIPGPGDSNGRGVFAAVVKGDTLCYVLTASRIEPATAAHIHVGPVGVAGPIVVGLQTPNPISAGCISTVPDSQNTTSTLTESELAAIVANKRGYYVNVHNAPFPAGAIRGQLR